MGAGTISKLPQYLKMLGNNMSSVFIGDEYSSFDIRKLTTIRLVVRFLILLNQNL